MANMFTINFNSSLKTIRVNAPWLNPPVIINQIEGISLNGTWATGGDASNLSVNNTNFAQGSGSLQFDIDEDTLYGPNLVTNGNFTGSATGWTLGAGWAYNSNNIIHTAGVLEAYQNVGATDSGLSYKITATIGGTTGTVLVGIGTAEVDVSGTTFSAGAGVSTVTVGGFGAGDVVFSPSNDFDGTIDSVSVTVVLTGVGYIENSTMESVNLSEVENQAYLFVWIYVPTGSSLDSVGLRWGSGSSNYWTQTVSQNQQATTFVNGWNLCQFIWSTSTTVGSPDSEDITYARVTLSTNAAMTGCLVNGLDSILGTILSYEYYSKYMFRNVSTGAYQETVLDDSDLINLDTESFNLLTYKTAALAVQQQQGLDASFYDGPFFENKYQAELLRYKSMYKSELQKPQSVYYQTPDTSYNRFMGRGWW